MNSIVMVSPALTGACDVSQPVAPPDDEVADDLSLQFDEYASTGSAQPVPARSAVPPGQAEVPADVQPLFPHESQPSSTFAVQRSKKPLLTLTGLFFALNEMLSGAPRLDLAGAGM